MKLVLLEKFPVPSLLVTAFVLPVLSACQTASASDVQLAKPALACNADSVTTACLLASANRALTRIDNPAQWITAASEYAIALHANGQGKAAARKLQQAAIKAEKLPTPAQQSLAAIEIAKAAARIGQDDIALQMVASGESKAAIMEEGNKKYDLLGKLASAQASAGEMTTALQKALALPHSDESRAAFKARTMREIAVAQAKSGDLKGAEETIAGIIMGLTYYRSTVRSDVATLTFKAGEKKRALRLLKEAEQIARAQDNGYFVAGALRDIAVSYVRGDMLEKAVPLFEDAKVGARAARSNQERARALSRIATSLSDCGQYDKAVTIFAEALMFADLAKSQPLIGFSRYEIAGSAAFSGDFEIAYALAAILPETSFSAANSLRAATQRDIAWGLVKHGRVSEALSLARSIKFARERSVTFSRMVLLIKNPAMEAHARYL